MYFDIHTHQTVESPDTVAIESIRFGQLPTLPIYSAGLHPWFLESDHYVSAINWLEANAQLPSVVAIGESGLDKLVKTPWELQVKAFEKSAEVAESVQKPLIIHCVRAFQEIIALKRRFSRETPWIIHGFNRNMRIGTALINDGFYLSFGKHILTDGHYSQQVLAATPPDRFFLETDDGTVPISAIYNRAAAIRNIYLSALKDQLAANVFQVFNLKSTTNPA